MSQHITRMRGLGLVLVLGLGLGLGLGFRSVHAPATRRPRLRTPNASPNRNGQCPRTSDTPAEAAHEADRLGQVILGLGAVLRVVLVPEIAGDQREISGRSARRRAGVRVRGASETGPSRLCRFWAAIIRPMAMPKQCHRRDACGSALRRTVSGATCDGERAWAG